MDNITREEKNVVITALYELQKNHEPGDKNDLYIKKLINKITENGFIYAQSSIST